MQRRAVFTCRGQTFFVVTPTFPAEFFRYRIITSSAQRMTARQTRNRHPQSFESPVTLKRLDSVVRTARHKPTLPPDPARKRELVKPNQSNEKTPNHGYTPIASAQTPRRL